jgi:hypothetical protein
MNFVQIFVECKVSLADGKVLVSLIVWRVEGKKDPKRIDEGRLVVREFLAKRSECPFSDILSILCRSENGTTLHDSINADVVGMLLDELDAWATKAGENGSGIPFLVKKRAFNVFSSNRGSAFAVKVARAFRMVPDRMRFRRCISRLVSRRGYAKVITRNTERVFMLLSQNIND